MNCPRCKSKKHVEIDLHAEGFCSDICECGSCGCVWTYSGNDLKIIKENDASKSRLFSDFICPTCKSILCIETDLDAFQFHEEIQECANCGTVCSTAHNHVEVIRDSQKDSFLSCSSDLVESVDYVFI